MKNILPVLMLLSLALSTHADLPANNTPEELERWFKSNDEEWKPQDINDGQLTFLTGKPKYAPHIARNKITVPPSSLRDGWVLLTQCHAKLDTLPAAQIVYKNHPIRKLNIIEHRNIEKVWVEGETVQLKKIRANALVCIEAEIRALEQTSSGQFTLVTGPYQRKFLDGYFPVAMTMDISYPDNLVFVNTTPGHQPGFNVNTTKNTLKITALFEGKLTTKVRFLAQKSTNLLK